MNAIAKTVILIGLLSHLSLGQSGVLPAEGHGLYPRRNGRLPASKTIDENMGQSNDSAFAAPKDVRGNTVSEIRKAERVSDSEKSQIEDVSSISSVPLPNTMDGLNDKRPLSIGDRLSFRVVEDEGPARTLSVTDSGEIDVPYIGRVPIANRTCKQFAYYVKRLLEKEYYYQATILVGLDAAGVGTRTVSRGRVYVMGQVRSAGPQDIPADEAYTVSKAILRAGGFGPYANKKKVKIVRGGKSGANSKPIFVDCAEILDKGHWDKDVEVRPDDIITVPERMFNVF